MRIHPVLGILVLCVVHSAMLAQSPGAPPACWSDELRQLRKLQDPRRALSEQRMDQAILLHRRNAPETARDAYLTIPVVVHIVHGNGDENISDAQVVQGIADLNEAFANTGFYEEEDGVDTHIRFCLAQQDPFGQPTTGITRTESSLTDLTSESQDAQLKALINWYPTEYLNIWLVHEITSMAMGTSVAGYATLPSSHGMADDGIVNEARWFGSTPTHSKVHIHEAGHYLGLYHTFEGGCANNNCMLDGDRVCDTPPDASTAPACAGSPANSCSTDEDDPSLDNPYRPVLLGGLGDVDDLSADYMDYGLQDCQHLFTHGQSDRMNDALVAVRSSLLSSEGCAPACPNTQAGFAVLTDPIVIGAAATFVDQSVCPDPHSNEWFVDDVSVAVTTDLTHTFNGPGAHTVRSRVHNDAQGCFDEFSRMVVVECNAQAMFTISPPDPDPGELVTFTSTATNATQITWDLDGEPLGQTTTVQWVFDDPGAHSMRLVAQNAACTDTSDHTFIPVGSCTTGMNNHMIVSNRAMIDFGTGEPVLLPQQTVGLLSVEGLSSISDRFGHLLFYTDGQQVVNAQGDPIVSGLHGGESSSQAALIVPAPGYDSLFYIFTTTDHQSGPNGYGLEYSIINMNGNGGSGEAMLVNQPLMDQTSEKLTAVRGCDGQSIWVLGLKRSLPEFQAFQLTSAGLQTQPVVSTVGFTAQWDIGCMKLSPRGDKIAAAFYYGTPNHILLFDFDNATGVVSNATDLGITQCTPYGVEFSPDGSKVYVTNDDAFALAQNHVYQIDISSGVEGIMANSMMAVGLSAGRVASMQLAPNGRIYGTAGPTGTLFEIRHPNEAGEACGFIDGSVDVGAGISGFGISNLVPLQALSVVPDLTGPTTVCPGTGPTSYALSCAAGGATITHSGANDLVAITDTSVVLDLQSIGVDTLIVTSSSPCASPNADTLIVTTAGPQVFLGNDTSICNPGQLVLDAGPGALSYQWQNSLNERFLTVTEAGTYAVTVTGIGGCTASDEITVSTFPSQLEFEFGPDIETCPTLWWGFWIHAPSGYVSYEWSTGATQDSVYWQSSWPSGSVTVTDSLGCQATDTFEVTALGPLDLGPNDTLCQGQTLLLELPHASGVYYSWWDGSTDNTHTIYGPGFYWVTRWGCNGWNSTDTITFFSSIEPVIDLGNDTLLCPFQPAVLGSPDSSGNFFWSDGSTNSTLTVTMPGDYWLTVVNTEGCVGTDTVNVSFCTGLADPDFQGAQVFPNPTHGSFDLHLAAEITADRAILVDARGRIVRELTRLKPGLNHIPEPGLASGVYELRLVAPHAPISIPVLVH